MLAIAMLALSMSAIAQEEEAENLPVIEIRADRVCIFPQRVADLGEDATVWDMLQMFPEPLLRSYDGVIDKYVVRMENLNRECDVRVFLTTLKAKYVEKIQIVDNPDVMKGSKNLGGVIDINMVRGAQEKDIYVGIEADTRNHLHFPVFNALYGNGKTDVMVTASINDKSLHGNFDGMARYHATVNHAANDNHNFMFDVMGHYGSSDLDGAENSRFHGTQFQYDGVFNEKGTMLTVLSGFEYYDDKYTAPYSSALTHGSRNREFWQIYIVELNTPIARGLDLCLGWEGDYAGTRLTNSQHLALSNAEKLKIQDAFGIKNLDDNFAATDKFRTMNNDAYIQFDYAVGDFAFTLGDRVMFYHYGYKNDINSADESRNDPYNLMIASMLYKPSYHHQFQGAYYRRFVSPDSYDTHNYLHFDTDGRTVITGNQKLDYQPADVYRVAYTFSQPKVWTSLIASYIDTHDITTDIETMYNGVPVLSWGNDPTSCSITNIDLSTTIKTGALMMTVGGSFYNKHISGDDTRYGYIRLNPSLNFGSGWKIDAHAVWCSKHTAEKVATDTDVYGMLSLQKSIGKHLTVAAQWHDMFCKDFSTGNFRLMYYF